MPPTPDFSFTSLDEFVNKPVVENCKAMSSEEEPKGNPQMDLQDQRVTDSECLRHMIGNMSYITNYEEIDGGYVAFGGNSKGGKITGKGTIKTGNLDFENGDLVSKRIERSGELKTRKRVEYIKNRQSVRNGIGVNAGDSKLMLLGINLILLVKVNAVTHKLTTAGES
ncbi:hypothetical protein Tco_1471554 [Tanacetum coccineum]